jgi:outer membrane receptor protein involved in Fe transport
MGPHTRIGDSRERGALGRTFTLYEKQTAGYAMATWNADPAWTVLGGVRLERTKTTVAGQVLLGVKADVF